MEPEFKPLIDRAARLRMTEAEMWKFAGLSYATYWRAREGKTKLPSIIKVVRKIEASLRAAEQVPPVCPVCDKIASDPATRACTVSNCGMAFRHRTDKAA